MVSNAVAIVGDLSAPGGVQSCILTLVSGLNAQGVVPDLLWDLPPARELLASAGVEVGHVPLRFAVGNRVLNRLPGGVRYLLGALNVARGDLRRPRYRRYYLFYNGFLVPPEVEHVYYLSGPPLLPQLRRTRPGIAGVPARVCLRLYDGLVRRTHPAYEYHRGNRYVINSEYTAGLFEEAHGVRLPVVYPPIDLRGRSFEDDDLGARDSITFFSRIVDYKRPELVVRLAARHPRMRCVVMGGVRPKWRRFAEGLRNLAESLGVRLELVPNPSSERVGVELRRARFFVFPARNEHFGMTTPEAMACGAIPFVHDSGGQREIVIEPRCRFRDDDMERRFEELVALEDWELKRIRREHAVHVRRYSKERFVEGLIGHAGG